MTRMTWAKSDAASGASRGDGAARAGAHDLTGRLVGNYLVERRLAEGGMGTVYEARHRYLGRGVAIKVLRPELAGNAALLGRFVNEACAAHAVQHPGVVEVFDLGTLPEGLPYMMMELLAGESLGERLARLGPAAVTVPRAIDLACQAAAALGAAHARGIVHRDLKPDNLVLLPDRRRPGHDLVKLIDFGVARVGGSLRQQPVHTIPGSLLGTPAYMSPEQCRGLDDDIDQRADVYSLGVLLYELVCGAPPFVSRGWGDLLAMHLTRPPTPPSELRPDLPAGLEEVLLAALEKDPAHRIASMAALAEQLRAVPVLVSARSRDGRSGHAHARDFDAHRAPGRGCPRDGHGRAGDLPPARV